MEKNTELWRKIVELYNRTKVLTLRAEEIAEDRNSFVPPIVQHRDSLDHITRVMAAELDMSPTPFANDEDRSKYIAANLDKALGHQYRAFFDAADFLGILFREEIEAIQKRFSIEAIESALPDYYSVKLPRVIAFSKKIGKIRERKDIGEGKELLDVSNVRQQIVTGRILVPDADADIRMVVKVAPVERVHEAVGGA